jgi:Raf kinase inhibitor-like YbhB/YbcL family protein
MHFKVGVCAVACLGLLGACSKSAKDGAAGSGGSGAAGQVSGTGGSAGSRAMGTGGGSGTAGKASGTGTGGSGAAGSSTGGSSAAGSGASGSGASGSGASGSGASGRGAGGSAGSGGGSFSVESKAFKDGSKIDTKYRCMGPSPDLAWSAAPSATMSYAAVLKDVTPGISQGYLHWVIYDIPASVASLPENVPIAYAPAAPAGAHQAPIWNNTVGFNGPCAPSGTNTYELTVYAVDVATLPGLSMSSTGADTVTAIEAHKLTSAKLTIMSSP